MKPELKEYYYSNGKIKNQYWLLNGKLHNENGLAYICYFKDGRIQEQGYRLNGKVYTEEEFKRYKLIKEMAGII